MGAWSLLALVLLADGKLEFGSATAEDRVLFPDVAQIILSAEGQVLALDQFADARIGTIAPPKLGPMLLDLKTGKARAAGKPFPDFGCLNGEARRVWGAQEPCASERWSGLLGVDAQGRWLVTDHRPRDAFWSRLRSFDSEGNQRVLWEAGEGEESEVSLSPERDTLCFNASSRRAKKDPVEYETCCGPVDGPYRSLAKSTTARPSESFWVPGKVLLGGLGNRTSRTVDLATGAETLLDFPNSATVTYFSGATSRQVVAHVGSNPFLVNFETKTVTALRPSTHVTLDPANPKHVFVGACVLPHCDLYEATLS
jgi:hypothetical protein